MSYRSKRGAAVAFLAFVGLWVVGLLRDAPRSYSPPGQTHSFAEEIA